MAPRSVRAEDSCNTQHNFQTLERHSLDLMNSAYGLGKRIGYLEFLLLPALSIQKHRKLQDLNKLSCFKGTFLGLWLKILVNLVFQADFEGLSTDSSFSSGFRILPGITCETL